MNDMSLWRIWLYTSVLVGAWLGLTVLAIVVIQLIEKKRGEKK